MAKSRTTPASRSSMIGWGIVFAILLALVGWFIFEAYITENSMLRRIGFGFDDPWWLLLLLLLPMLWIYSFKSLANLGPNRRMFALILRSVVLTAIIVALAGIQWRQINDKLTVIYLLDQSESIPLSKRESMLDYVTQAVSTHRDGNRGDRASIIVFGGEAKVEVPPFDDDIPAIDKLESVYDLKSENTSLEAAMKLAKAIMPEDSGGRVVIITDGNENIGNSIDVGRSLADGGIGIDALPINLDQDSEVIVQKISLPADIRKGQSFEARVVVDNFSTEKVPGRITVYQESQQQKTAITNSKNNQVELDPGKNVFSYKLKIEHSGVHKYHAVFTPDDPGADRVLKNNESSAFTHVRGKGRVLLIEDWESPGDFDYLVQRMRAMNMEVIVMPSNSLFSSAADLIEYDSVILANVPRASGIEDDDATSFSEGQIQALVNNTSELGCGLVMIGGESSFGAGGWSGTELEKAMPVDFQVKNDKVRAVGALCMVMHACEMPDGNHWQKVVGIEAIKTLGPTDYCGVIEWGGASGVDRWLWKRPMGLDRVFGNKKMMLQRVSRMTPGDMPSFDSSMRIALAGFKKVNASVNHMIMISDGDPVPPSQALLQGFKDAKIQITTVAVGTHGPPTQTPLQRIANFTGGKFYNVRNPKALPKIYQREARKVSRPLIFEPPGGVQVQSNDISSVTGITQGIPIEAMPKLGGYVLTEIKSGALVEQVLIANKPTSQENSTILATWRYGLGRATVLTTDAGKKWATDLQGTDYYDKFFSQLIRHSMRPINENANFAMASEYKDGKIRVVVNALDEEDEFLNNLEMQANVVSPDGENNFKASFVQKGSGRYIAEFDAPDSGSYLFSVIPGEGYERLSSGVNVPFSSEYSDRETNEGLITSLVSLTPKDGEAGKIIDGELSSMSIDSLLKVNPFREGIRPAVSARDVWPWLVVLCAVAFFADVFVRRVQVGFEWLKPVFNWISVNILGRVVEEEQPSRLARLQQRKAEVNQKIEQQKAATRFAPEVEESAPQRSLDEVVNDVAGTARQPTETQQSRAENTMTPAEAEEEGYTSRLLAAKRRAQKDNKQE